jgi:molybdopterin converting factor small subunit
MRINFYADLRPAAGAKTLDVPVHAPITARQALESVTDTRPELAKKIWQSAGSLFQHIHVFVNGRQSVFLPLGLDTLVDLGDELDVFPPVGGGENRLVYASATEKIRS